MYYVTMTDKFLSGWGGAENRISKFIVVCETLNQARTIVEAAEHRDEMIRINIRHSKPNYPISKYHSSFREYKELGECWTKYRSLFPADK